MVVVVRAVVVVSGDRDGGRGLVVLNPIKLGVWGRVTRWRESIVIQRRAVDTR